MTPCYTTGDLRLAPCRRRDEKEALALQSHTQSKYSKLSPDQDQHEDHEDSWRQGFAASVPRFTDALKDKTVPEEVQKAGPYMAPCHPFRNPCSQMQANYQWGPKKFSQSFPLDPSALFASKSQKHPPDLDHILGHAYILIVSYGL